MKSIIIIKGELTDLNKYIREERRNRFAGAKLKKDNTEYVMWKTKGLPKVTFYPLHVHIDWYTKNEMVDPDNIAFAKKYVLDGLVENGIIPDDSRKIIHSLSDAFYVDVQPRLVITLTPSEKNGKDKKFENISDKPTNN